MTDFSAPAHVPVPRVLADTGTHRRGPTLVCVGGLHGNEPSGVHALQRVAARLGADARGLQGRLLGLAGNRGALAANRRFLDYDLNRAWLPERVELVRKRREGLRAEDGELHALDRRMRMAIAAAKGPVSILDLHSTSGGGPAFVTLDDTLPNREFAFHIPAPHVLGLEEELAGTMLAHWITKGLTAIGFEAGQHTDPGSVDRSEAAVWIALEAAGVLEGGSRPEVAHSRVVLNDARRGLPDVVEVRHRHAVSPGDGFEMLPGYRSFQSVRADEQLAHNGGSRITAPEKGMILMPLYQDQGADGFFLIRSVRPLWLRLSSVLRRMHAARWAHWLPGVERDPERPGSFLVDRSRARLYALEIFHLLGFKRQVLTEAQLAVSPRGRQS